MDRFSNDSFSVDVPIARANWSEYVGLPIARANWSEYVGLPIARSKLARIVYTANIVAASC